MPYRNAASTGIESEVLCKACGAPYAVTHDAREDETFRCRGCSLEQEILRDDDRDFEPALSVAAHIPGGYSELSDFARSLGALEKVISLDVSCAGVIVEVSLSISSGHVQTVDFVATGARGGTLPTIRFVAEKKTHVDAKERDIAREVQTGDASFDAKVYIESDAADVDVGRVLSPPAIRRAIARLLDLGTEAVKLEPSLVSISINPRVDGMLDAAKMAERVRLVRTLVGGPRPLALQKVPGRPRSLLVARIAAYSVLPLATLVFVLGMTTFEPARSTIFFVGFPAGLVVAALVQPLFTRAVRGRSTSQRDLVAIRLPTMTTIPFLIAGLLVVANGAFDRSQERIVEMEITSTSADTDDSAVTHVHCVDSGGSSHSYPFHVGVQPITKAYYIRARWKSGALGFAWESSKAVLTDSPRQAGAPRNAL